MTWTPALPPAEEGAASGSDARPPAGEVWMAGEDEGRVRAVEALLTAQGYRVRTMTLRALETQPIERAAPAGLVLLDIGSDVDRGWRLIRKLRKARLAAPIVVMTESQSRDFGAKILQEGIGYYLSHEYSEQELLELVHSLTKAP